ncbi:PAS domain-containing sensor histidine kinase [Halogeometricum limi]|uniref:histidine kinase n=1 Tax=Halogeometricum limi TaxID=555875 RepID=A0A1I6I4P3_9EURY|nr:PAS domain-containing sensor histidine kinase [Halogeometricum limi]SFR61716.1 Signal transduction histidine kinase [Halogeometricum limi]
MTSDEASPPLRVVRLHPAGGDETADRELDVDLSEADVVVADGISEGVDRCDGTVDCVVSPYELTDGTADDLFDRLPESGSPPVVLVVDGGDGTVPAAAVTAPFADVVRRDRPDFGPRLADAVRDVVPDRTNPRVVGAHPTEASEMDAWKANLFDHLFTEIPLHVFVKDRTGRHVVVSEGPVESRIHRESSAYLGRRDVDGVVPDAEARGPYEDDLSVVATGEPILEKEEHFAETDRWFVTSKVPWRADGEIVGLVGIAEEITSQKDRERQLRITNHVVRHNMRNKLNIVVGRAALLANEEPSGHLDSILSAAEDLLGLIDEQQVILGIMVGDPDPRPIDLSAVVRRVVRSVSDDYPDAEVTCRVDSDAVVSATENVHYAVSELVENAVVHADDPAPEVTVTVEAVGDDVSLRVADAGPPIPRFEVEILTDRQPIDQISHSSGLGLWVVRWVVKHADGTVSFAERETGGNEVTVTFDRAAEHEP